MAHRIASVDPEGIAAQCGIKRGDTLLSINGIAIIDQIDYQFLTAQSKLTLALNGALGDVEIAINKKSGEPLGLTFESTLMSRPRTCANNCVFCFVDQMPSGMRDTLYVKDDDWRLSLMMGNYITLTNVSDAEFDRIIARRASPLYLSIHATDAAVRARMMGNPRAAGIVPQLERLKAAGLRFHCQIVLCPGINDGATLDDTIQTLAALFPAACSAALVPVGLTRHREGLAALAPYTKDRAAALIDQAHGWQDMLLKKIGTRFVFPADELYCLSGCPLPEDAAYERYPQIENGVGLLRSFQKEFSGAYGCALPEEAKPRSVLIATGTSAAPFLSEMLASHPLPGVRWRVMPVENRFFGSSVTVAGLLTGQDLLRALRGQQADELLLSQAMLRHDDAVFLDGMRLDDLSSALGIPIHIAGCDGADFFYAVEGGHYEPQV